ncbi:MAG: hypothetical protein V7609_813 [Verrucomicrobiota bacterium]
MRILTVCTSTNVFGAEVITLKMLEGFARAGHEQLAVTSTWTDGEFNRRLAKIGVPEHRLPFGALSIRLRLQPMWWTMNVLVRLPSLWMGWKRAMRQFQPDIVLFTSWRHPLAVYPILDATPSFLIEYSFLDLTKTRRKLYRVLTRKLAGFIAVSEFMRDHVKLVGAPADKVYLVKSAAFSGRDREAVEREAQLFAPNPTAATLRIGIIGQISPHKGHDDLVEAVIELRRRSRAFVVYVFGTGSTKYVDQLKSKLSDAGLNETFSWSGFVKERANIYGSIDVCVVPSRSGDPFPTVAMEAGAYGRPVVASRRGGLPEIIVDGITGWLDDLTQPRKFADRLEWFYDNPEAARGMGLAGRERIFREFTQEKMISDFESLFRRHLAGEERE